MTDDPPIPPLVGDLFRRSAGEITAVLLRRSRGWSADRAEEAVQDAFVQALRTWPRTTRGDGCTGSRTTVCWTWRRRPVVGATCWPTPGSGRVGVHA